MPRRPHTHEEREAIRQKILTAARTLFEETGIDAVSMRAVGARAGLSAAALYTYFPAKLDLVRAIWSDAVGLLTSRLAAISAAQPDPLAALVDLGRAYADFALQDPLRFRILFLWGGESLHDAFLNQPEPQIPYRLLRDRVEEARALGRLAADADPDLVAQTVWSAVHGAVTLTITCPDFILGSPKNLVDTLLATVTAGLISRGQS